jgi:hypothetical protein
MPKSKELHKVISILSKYGVKFTYSKRGRHRRKFYRGKLSFPVKTHGKKTGILPYALKGLIKNLIYHKIYLMKKK